jgi:hypothetical protein
MVHYEIRGKEVQFIVKIESVVTDYVSGTFSGNAKAFGEIVYAKASADNLMLDFQPTVVTVQLDGDGVIDQAHNYKVVANKETGFIGVVDSSNSLKAGSIVFVSGFFVRTSTDADAIAANKLSDSPSLAYGTTGEGNIVGSTLSGTKVL